MCFNLVTHKEWLCGWREHTGRHGIDCRRSICRLSNCHKVQQHDCQKTCEGTQTEEQHLIMSTAQVVCNQCQEAGRGPGEHPGIEITNSGSGPQFSYVVANYGTA
ncbi:hypothetical protein LXA43DRAFT_666399 [Ganoderma leucocontextum]|nr:hypothetical protein LXA43DRAFT_666399 [Ganoderma leucocontextum]